MPIEKFSAPTFAFRLKEKADISHFPQKQKSGRIIPFAGNFCRQEYYK
jgi:hypothetical protein